MPAAPPEHLAVFAQDLLGTQPSVDGADTVLIADTLCSVLVRKKGRDQEQKIKKEKRKEKKMRGANSPEWQRSGSYRVLYTLVHTNGTG